MDTGEEFVALANKNPIPEQDFLDLAKIAIEALDKRRRAFPPDIERFTDESPPSGLIFSDVPVNHMAFSVAEECNRRFNGDPNGNMFQSFMFRWMAISREVESEQLAPFVRRTGNSGEVRASVFKAAACHPMQSKQTGVRFADGFVEVVRQKSILEDRDEK